MEIGPKTLGRATEVRDRVNKVMDAVRQQDGVEGTDLLKDQAGEVAISLDTMERTGYVPVRVPMEGTYKDEVVTARLSFDPATSGVSKGQAQCTEYYDSSYGRSAEDRLSYGLEMKTGKDGRPVLEYTQVRQEYYVGHNTKERITVDPASGQILSYQGKEFGETLGQATRELISLPGIGLTVAAGLLAGCPGTLTGTLFGPVAGFVAAGATAAALIYAKMRPERRVLPTHNE